MQIKTTASSTYRVWPNSGALEPGETARVQVLLCDRLPACRPARAVRPVQLRQQGLAYGGWFGNSSTVSWTPAELVQATSITVPLTE